MLWASELVYGNATQTWNALSDGDDLRGPSAIADTLLYHTGGISALRLWAHGLAFWPDCPPKYRFGKGRSSKEVIISVWNLSHELTFNCDLDTFGEHVWINNTISRTRPVTTISLPLVRTHIASLSHPFPKTTTGERPADHWAALRSDFSQIIKSLVQCARSLPSHTFPHALCDPVVAVTELIDSGHIATLVSPICAQSCLTHWYHPLDQSFTIFPITIRATTHVSRLHAAIAAANLTRWWQANADPTKCISQALIYFRTLELPPRLRTLIDSTKTPLFEE